MTRRLIMMRHAKSSWSSGAPNDHARPLNKRGRRSAAAMGPHLVQIGWRPDRVVLSDSKRTQQTFELLGFEPPVEAGLEPALYHGGVAEVSAVLFAQPPVETLMLLGHEPGWSEAIEWLSGTQVTLKTGDAALLEVDDPVSWAQIAGAHGQLALVEVIRSREVAALSKDGQRVVR